jgi:L-threonylcarbamoyladenylate synthase
VSRVVSALKGGGVVAMRTDTVYGLLASVVRSDALEKLVRLKDRPVAKPFVALTSDWLGVRQLTSHLPPVARHLGAKHWPGPLTLVLPAASGLPREIVGAGNSVAVRIPNDALLLAILHELRGPVAAPSANRTGEDPAHTAQETIDVFGADLDLVVDGGRAAQSQPSAIVRCIGTHAEVLREGPIHLSPDDLNP